MQKKERGLPSNENPESQSSKKEAFRERTKNNNNSFREDIMPFWV